MQSYNPNKPSKFILYLDANNLYGQAMSQYFPYSGFKQLTQKEVNKLLLNLIGCNFIEKNSSDRYILELYPNYLNELHESHNYYPLAPERLEISRIMLLEYCSNIANKYGIKIGGVNKLVPNLGKKSKYVLHYRNLHSYLTLGMKLVSVHGILKFKQFDWLKQYIGFNI